MEAAIPLSGQVAGRIDSVRPVAEIVADVKREFFETIGALSGRYLAGDATAGATHTAAG